MKTIGFRGLAYFQTHPYTLQTFKDVFSKASLISLLRGTQSRAKVWVQLQKAQRPIDLIQDLDC